MEPAGRRAAQGGEGASAGFGGGQVLKPYDSFIRAHLRFYGYFRGESWPLCPPVPGLCPLLPLAAALFSPRQDGQGRDCHVPRETLWAASQGIHHGQHQP